MYIYNDMNICLIYAAKETNCDLKVNVSAECRKEDQQHDGASKTYIFSYVMNQALIFCKNI